MAWGQHKGEGREGVGGGEGGLPRGKADLTGLKVDSVESDCLGAFWGGLGPFIWSCVSADSAEEEVGEHVQLLACFVC